jgi:hypothetical protein
MVIFGTASSPCRNLLTTKASSVSCSERKSMRLSALTLVLVLLSVSVSFAGLLMSPYLQALTPTSVYVMVECDSPDTVTVQYGVDTGYGMSARSETIAVTTESTYVHRILVKGMSPNTLYHYRAGQGNLYSADSHFTTGVLPGTPFRFAWMADCRTGSLVYDSVMTHIALTGALLALYGGDLCTDPTYSAWKNEFFRPAQAVVGRTVPWVNATGNHEGWNTNTKAFTHAPAGAAAQDRFSFDCGDLHVLVLNSEFPLTPGTEQYAFADSDLARTNRTWKLVMLHAPAYCSGGHGEDAGAKALTAGVFEQHGVDLVLAGHSHFYQHNFVNGIHHMVIGAAGAPLYSPTSASYTLKSAMQYNWASGDVSPTSLRMFVFNERGAPLDTIILAKEGIAYDVQLARISKDTLRITSRTRNQLSHTLRVVVTLRDEAGALIDSLSLKDDGVHGDGVAGDGTWGELYVPSRDAMIYAAVRTDDLTAGTSWTLPDAAKILFTRGAIIAVDTRPVDLRAISREVARYDTTFLVTNTGYRADTLAVSLDPVNVVPDTAVMVFPMLFVLAPGESKKVTFRIRPNLLFPQYYNAQVIVEPMSSFGQSRFEKNYRFEIAVIGSVSIPAGRPTEFVLCQNFPNPFNPSTVIKCALPQKSHVTLTVYNTLGQQVAVLVNQEQEAGYYDVKFENPGLSSGVYLYRMQAGSFVEVKKLVLVR